MGNGRRSHRGGRSVGGGHGDGPPRRARRVAAGRARGWFAPRRRGERVRAAEHQGTRGRVTAIAECSLRPDDWRMDLAFRGELWEWRGPAPYHFVTVPEAESGMIDAVLELVTYGWGMV